MRQCMDMDNLHNRLKRVDGQIKAIDRMIEQDVPCEDIIIQINAAKTAALGKSYWRDISNTVSGMELNTEMQRRQSLILQRR